MSVHPPDYCTACRWAYRRAGEWQGYHCGWTKADERRGDGCRQDTGVRPPDYCPLARRGDVEK